MIAAVVFLSLVVSSISLERTDQQATADSSALAGANALAKGIQTIKLINFIIWSRNITLEVLYIAAVIATIATLGSAYALFEIPLKFEKATQSAVAALEKAKQITKEITPAYAVGSSVAYIQANGDGNNYGIAIPFPLDFNVNVPSAEERQLKERIINEEHRLNDARALMADAWVTYYDRKNMLKKDEIVKDQQLKNLRKIAEDKSGSVGGLTSQRNKLSKELDRLEGKRGRFFNAGIDGMVAIVGHSSTVVPFSSFFGGRQTGFNVALSAAKAAEGKADFVIGQEAVKNLSAKVPVLNQVGGTLIWFIDAINITGRNVDNLGDRYGSVGGTVVAALNRLNLVPPDITEVRPALTNIQEVTKNTFGNRISDLTGQVREMIRTVKDIEKKHDKKVLPDGFEI